MTLLTLRFCFSTDLVCPKHSWKSEVRRCIVLTEKFVRFPRFEAKCRHNFWRGISRAHRPDSYKIPHLPKPHELPRLRSIIGQQTFIEPCALLNERSTRHIPLSLSLFLWLTELSAVAFPTLPRLMNFRFLRGTTSQLAREKRPRRVIYNRVRRSCGSTRRSGGE